MAEQPIENLNIEQSPASKRPTSSSESAEFQAWKAEKAASKRPTPDSGGSRVDTTLTEDDLLKGTSEQPIDTNLKKALSASEHPQGKLQGFLGILNENGAVDAHDLQNQVNRAGEEQ